MKRTGTVIPSGILQPTQPEPEPESQPIETPAAEAGQGGAAVPIERPRAGRTKRKAAQVDTSEAVAQRLYLNPDVTLRLKLTAMKRNVSLSEVANEILDKQLPRWELNRVG
jgi:hypothetical protein